MNVLLACPGIFDQIGGGQRFYANLILSNPDIDFYCFGNPVSREGIPQNVHLIMATDVHWRHVGEFRLNRIRKGDAAEPLKNHQDELARLLDLAASVPPVPFAVVDIPDFLPLAVYFPLCLRQFGVAFDRVALSMHGTLSMGMLDNWAEDPGELSSLIEHENLLFRYCDIRYGIGRRYIDGWADACELPAHLLDIAKIYQIAPAPRRRPARYAAADTPPDLCFIGRQERWKGPDLFLELCSRLPRDSFGEVRFYGPPVDLHGHNSLDQLERLARHRSLDIVHEVIDAAGVAQRLHDEKMIVVLPSRRDTFNLVAMEALLSGCPAVVSTACGACDFLDAAYPGMPYIKIDPDDLLGSYDDILDLLADYDAARAALAAYLRTATPRDYGATLGQIYDEEPRHDPAARANVEQRFAAVCAWLDAGFLRYAREALADASVERCRAVLSSYGCDTVDATLARTAFSQAVDVVRIWQASRPLSRRPDWSAVDGALDRLSGYVFGGSRVSIYRLMAEWERSRGNDLLYATYWLRVMRLSGQIAEPTADAVRAILEKNGFAEVAAVTGLLHRDDEAEIYRYLSQRRGQFLSPPDDDVAAFIEIERPAAPKISVIVSVYNGARKIDTFVSGLERFTAAERAITEFIFVDSASVDDTGSELIERLRRAAARGVGALYIRSHERETIQRAWNRGIAAARGEYLAFLGVDEMNRPDSLAKMAAFLDRRRDIDWVQGSAVITEVNEAGSYVRDVMAYDRNFDSQHIHYLECCYISYVGALYRKSIHRRVGFYDDSFRAAGDTEFKNRALPFIRVATLPETFGTFLNYPEARTTQSPTAELEDIGAWHLHRTAGGVRYAFEGRNQEECAGQLCRALHYKKSYMDRICTDVEYAWNMAEYLRRHRPEAFAAIEHFAPNLLGLRIAYERFDNSVNPEFNSGAKGFEAIGGALERVWFGVAQAFTVHKGLGLPAQYDPASDNRWHQHHLLWPSTTRRTTAEEPDAADLAPAGGVYELAEAEAVPFFERAANGKAASSEAAFAIELSRPIGGSGWYDSEGSPGNWYRWTGPHPRFALEVLLSQDHAYLCDMVMAPVRPHVADDLSVMVNDLEVAHREEWQDGTLHLSFPIHNTLSQAAPDFCRILFRHKAVYSPGEEGSPDARRLGFAVRSIAFTPLAADTPDPARENGEAEFDPVMQPVAVTRRQPRAASRPKRRRSG